MGGRLSKAVLNKMFVDDLGSSYVVRGDVRDVPLAVSPSGCPGTVFKIYAFNCTNPVGGRTLDECKIQLILPGQVRGTRGVLDDSDGCVTCIVGFAAYGDGKNGAWVIWETAMHRDFAYSANLQVKSGDILRAMTDGVFSVKKRKNGEIIVVADRDRLSDAMILRQEVDLERLLEG